MPLTVQPCKCAYFSDFLRAYAAVQELCKVNDVASVSMQLSEFDRLLRLRRGRAMRICAQRLVWPMPCCSLAGTPVLAGPHNQVLEPYDR